MFSFIFITIIVPVTQYCDSSVSLLCTYIISPPCFTRDISLSPCSYHSECRKEIENIIDFIFARHAYRLVCLNVREIWFFLFVAREFSPVVSWLSCDTPDSEGRRVPNVDVELLEDGRSVEISHVRDKTRTEWLSYSLFFYSARRGLNFSSFTFYRFPESPHTPFVIRHYMHSMGCILVRPSAAHTF